jgi:hypothetical protein
MSESSNLSKPAGPPEAVEAWLKEWPTPAEAAEADRQRTAALQQARQQARAKPASQKPDETKEREEETRKQEQDRKRVEAEKAAAGQAAAEKAEAERVAAEQAAAERQAKLTNELESLSLIINSVARRKDVEIKIWTTLKDARLAAQEAAKKKDWAEVKKQVSFIQENSFVKDALGAVAKTEGVSTHQQKPQPVMPTPTTTFSLPVPTGHKKGIDIKLAAPDELPKPEGAKANKSINLRSQPMRDDGTPPNAADEIKIDNLELVAGIWWADVVKVVAKTPKDRSDEITWPPETISFSGNRCDKHRTRKDTVAILNRSGRPETAGFSLDKKGWNYKIFVASNDPLFRKFLDSGPEAMGKDNIAFSVSVDGETITVFHSGPSS